MFTSRTCLQSTVPGVLTDPRVCKAALPPRLRPAAPTPLPLPATNQHHRHRLPAKKGTAPDGEPPAAPKRVRKTTKKAAASDADAPRDTSPPKRRGRPPKAKAPVADPTPSATQSQPTSSPPSSSTTSPPTSQPTSSTPAATPAAPPTTSASSTATPPPSTPQPTSSTPSPSSQTEPPPTPPPTSAPPPPAPPAPIPVAAVNVVNETPDTPDDNLPTVQPPTGLAVNRQGYQSFEMDGVELLIAETASGQLKLSDCYVFDQSADLYAAPEMHGAIPDHHCTYQCIPWTEEYLGDVLTNKEPWSKIQKMVFIPLVREEPYELKLDDVFIFSAETRMLVKMPVERAGPFIVDPVLRIREDKVTIEDATYVPSFMEVQGAGEADRAPEPSLDSAWLAELQDEIAGYRAGRGAAPAAEPVSQQ